MLGSNSSCSANKNKLIGAWGDGSAGARRRASATAGVKSGCAGVRLHQHWDEWWSLEDHRGSLAC